MKIRQSIMLALILTTFISCQEQIALNKQNTQSSNDEHLVTNSSAITGNIVFSGQSRELIAIARFNYSEADIRLVFSALAIDIKTYIPRFRMIAFNATESQYQALIANPLIEQVQEDVKLTMSLSTATTQVRAREVRNLGVEGTGARVCIIDSGFNPHPDLASPESEYDFAESDSSADDDNGHGTAVAGIVASMAADLALVKGNSGVAPRATLLVAKVFGADGMANSSTIASALDWCAQNNAHIVNMSLGHGGFTSSCDTDLTAFFSNQIASQGIVVIAASGNDAYKDKVSSPACGSKVIGVGSVNKQDGHSSFSNAGVEVDLSAPGELITTTTNAGGYAPFSGTSAATPFVAGAAALLRSMPEKPSATLIKEALIKTTKDLGSQGKDFFYGSGRLDVAAAYQYIKSMGGTTGSTTGGLTGVTTGGSSGGTTGGSSGGTTGGLTGGTTGGTETPPPTRFALGTISYSNETKSGSYKSSQKTVTKDCPADHYLTDLEVKGATWFIYPSITWLRLDCQSMKTLNTMTEMGIKKGSSNARNLCADKKAITAMEIKNGSYVKDIKPECASVTYDTAKSGAVKIQDYIFSKYALGRGFFLDDKSMLECPDNTIAIGIEASYKSDSDEWAFTRMKLRCASISTK